VTPRLAPSSVAGWFHARASRPGRRHDRIDAVPTNGRIDSALASATKVPIKLEQFTGIHRRTFTGRLINKKKLVSKLLPFL